MYFIFIGLPVFIIALILFCAILDIGGARRIVGSFFKGLGIIILLFILYGAVNIVGALSWGWHVLFALIVIGVTAAVLAPKIRRRRLERGTKPTAF